MKWSHYANNLRSSHEINSRIYISLIRKWPKGVVIHIIMLTMRFFLDFLTMKPWIFKKGHKGMGNEYNYSFGFEEDDVGIVGGIDILQKI